MQLWPWMRAGGLCSVPVLCFVRKAEEGGDEGDDRWVRLAHLPATSLEGDDGWAPSVSGGRKDEGDGLPGF